MANGKTNSIVAKRKWVDLFPFLSLSPSLCLSFSLSSFLSLSRSLIKQTKNNNNWILINDERTEDLNLRWFISISGISPTIVNYSLLHRTDERFGTKKTKLFLQRARVWPVLTHSHIGTIVLHNLFACGTARLMFQCNQHKYDSQRRPKRKENYE